MAIYEWKGKEEPLGMNLITTRYMTVDELAMEGTTLSAKGSINVHDHVEGFDGADRWVASGILEGQLATPRWTVKPDPAEGFHFTDKNGEALFGLISATNDAIKTFVAAKLTALFHYQQKNPVKPIDLVDEMERYAGPKHEYAGPCLCKEIEDSRKTQPFDWKQHTDGGKYPANCFSCSCGTKWYRGNPPEERWVRVADDEAWTMLTEFNGEPVEYIAIDPQSPMPQLVLERTLRKRGLIPIG